MSRVTRCVTPLDDNNNIKVKCFGENKMKNLGIMNGWKEQPAEYTKHLAECGTEYQATIIYNEKHPSGVGLIRKERQETRRKYDTVATKVGTHSVKTTVVCNECNCKWESWS